MALVNSAVWLSISRIRTFSDCQYRDSRLESSIEVKKSIIRMSFLFNDKFRKDLLTIFSIRFTDQGRGVYLAGL
jgi:hypothetical protein